MTRECVICGSKLRSGQLHCCSPKCYGEYRSIHFVGSNNPKYNQARRVCGYCKKEFFVNRSRVKNGKGKHCSRKCADKHKSIWMLGEKHHSWRGGRWIRKDGYIIIAKNGRRELEHRAVIGVNDPDLIVHHIDGNPSNNSSDNLEVMTKAEHNRIHNPERVRRREFRKKKPNERSECIC